MSSTPTILIVDDEKIIRTILSKLIRTLGVQLHDLIRYIFVYGLENVGGIVRIEMFKVRDGWNVEKVLKVLRRFGKEIENLNYVYVVDDDDLLVGVLPLHALLFAEPKALIGDVANADFPFASAGQDQEEVAHIFEKYDVLALPVVDERGELIGRTILSKLIRTLGYQALQAANSDEALELINSHPLLTAAAIAEQLRQ